MLLSPRLITECKYIMNKASLRIIRTLTFFSGRRGHLQLLFSLMNRICSNKKFWPWILKSRLLLCKHFFTNFHPSEDLGTTLRHSLHLFTLHPVPYILLFVAKFESCWISWLTYKTSRKSYIFCREDRNRLKRSIKKRRLYTSWQFCYKLRSVTTHPA
jgi:hypothetical protein